MQVTNLGVLDSREYCVGSDVVVDSVDVLISGAVLTVMVDSPIKTMVGLISTVAFEYVLVGL